MPMSTSLKVASAPSADMAAPTVVGVDGWRNGWIAVSVPVDSPTAGDIAIASYEDFAALLDDHEGARLIGVDIPLSLPAGAQRASDAALRGHLGARSSSLFPTPCREAAAEASWEAANATSRRLTGKGLSKQTWYLVPKVDDARTAITDAACHASVYEAHPESCFVAMGGSDDLASKKTAAGIGQRLALLEADLGALGGALAGTPAGPTLDDVLDALAVCWTLRRIERGDALWFGPPGVDDQGFPTAVPV